MELLHLLRSFHFENLIVYLDFRNGRKRECEWEKNHWLNHSERCVKSVIYHWWQERQLYKADSTGKSRNVNVWANTLNGFYTQINDEIHLKPFKSTLSKTAYFTPSQVMSNFRMNFWQGWSRHLKCIYISKIGWSIKDFSIQPKNALNFSTNTLTRSPRIFLPFVFIWRQHFIFILILFAGLHSWFNCLMQISMK